MKPHDQQGEVGDNDDFGLERQSRMKRAFFKETYGALLHRGLKGGVKDFYTLCKKRICYTMAFLFWIEREQIT